MGFVELLRMPSLKEEKRGLFIEHIAKSSNQLLIIVDDILELSRLDAGDVLLKEEQVDAASVVKGVYEKVFKSRSSRVDPELPTVRANVCPRTLIGDAFRLQQVLEKLVDNAIKFTPKGKVSFGYQNMGPGEIALFVEGQCHGRSCCSTRARLIGYLVAEDDEVNFMLLQDALTHRVEGV